MLTWPSELPNPDSRSFNVKMIDTTIRTPMGKGHVRTRPQSKRSPTQIECNWSLSGAQEELLRNFYRVALREGSSSFLWPCPSGTGYHTQEVIFTEPPAISYVDPGEWVASGKLLVQDSFGPTFWLDLGYTAAVGDSVAIDDKNTDFTLGDLVGGDKVTRIDIFVRTAPNSGGGDSISVGFVGGSGAELASAVSIGATDHVVIQQATLYDGGYMGDVLSVPKTLKARWSSSGTPPTKGDMVVIVRYVKG